MPEGLYDEKVSKIDKKTSRRGESPLFLSSTRRSPYEEAKADEKDFDEEMKEKGGEFDEKRASYEKIFNRIDKL